MEFNCAECPYKSPFNANSLEEMKQHILNMHPHYSPEEAADHAQIWLDDAWDAYDAQNINWDGN